MKLCRRCKIEKDRSEFWANKRQKDGLGVYCKACAGAAAAKSRAKHGPYRYDATEHGKHYRATSGVAKVSAANRNAKRWKVPGRLTVADWAALREAQHGTCARCPSPIEQLDHIIPVCDGGTNSRDNVQGLCKPCHEAKTGQEYAARTRQAITHCSRGHEYTRANTYIKTDGRRNCKTCRRLSSYAGRNKSA